MPHVTIDTMSHQLVVITLDMLHVMVEVTAGRDHGQFTQEFSSHSERHAQ